MAMKACIVAVILLQVGLWASAAPASPHVDPATGRVPVIFDTDIGTDFDDSAAIAFALSNPIYDIKLIVSATGDTVSRAKIVAKYLHLVGRTEIPVGVGVPNQNHTNNPLYGWSSDYDLADYPGTVYNDGVGAMIDIISKSTVPVTILAIAPATNFPDLLSRGGASVVKNAQIVAMSGSIYRGYNNSTQPAAEYNVKTCPGCTELMYTAGWRVTTTPLDTCGTAHLEGPAYDTFLKSNSSYGLVLVECYVYWSVHGSWDPRKGGDVWYDAVAAFLADFAFANPFVNYSELKLRVTSDGHTVVDAAKGTSVNVALTWAPGKEDAFESYLAETISGTVSR